MSGLEADTIGGYNSLLEKQKKEDGNAIVSTVLLLVIGQSGVWNGWGDYSKRHLVVDGLEK